MGEAIREVTPFYVKYNDVFHLKNLYNMMHEFLIDENWLGEDGMSTHPTDHHRDIEKMYFEKNMQKGVHRGGKEMWIWWRVYKSSYNRGNPYFKFKLEIDFHGVYLVKQEIMHQGKKLTADRGEMLIEFRPKIIRTGGEAWKKHWFLKHFWDIYEKRIISQDLDKAEKELWREAYRIQAAVKSFLQLRNFVPVPEPFHPPRYAMEETA